MRSGSKTKKTDGCLTCFGTGDGCPNPTRNHAAFLYRFGKTSLLVDCGEAIDRTYKASGLSYDLIDSIFISHLHADHFGGFFMLLQGFWLEGRRKDLTVYLPSRALQPVRQMLQAGYLFEEILPFSLRLQALEPATTITVGQARITPFPSSHLTKTQERFGQQYSVGFEAYCFLLESEHHRIGHSADLGKPEDLTPLFAQPLDLLVCELAHFVPEEIFRYLQGRDLKQIVWVHIGQPYRQNLSRIRLLATKMLPKIRHTFADDGQEIPLNLLPAQNNR